MSDTCGLSRANSKSRGIHLKTVSPSPVLPSTPKSTPLIDACPRWEPTPRLAALSSDADNTEPRRPLADSSNVPRSSSIPGSKNAHFDNDLPLPTSADLESLDLNDKLRLLALKEMSVVEIKDAITTLNSRLRQSERDLQSLRTLIQRSLYKQINGRTLSSKDQHITTQRDVSNTSQLSALKQSTKQHNSHPRNLSASPSHVSASSGKENSSKLWSNISKPITFIQNLDSMLSHEFEKSLASDPSPFRQPSVSPSPAGARSKTRRDVSGSHNAYKDLLDAKMSSSSYPSSGHEDVFQVVSNSLWNFVNDMKSNMVASMHEDNPKAVPKIPPRNDAQLLNLDNGSAISLSPVPSESDYSMDIVDHCDDEDEEEDDKVDLSIYSSMRRDQQQA